MFKKTLMAGAGATLLAGMLFGRDAVSYVTTSAGWIQDSIKDSVPLEFEIERARNMVQDLVPEIEKNLTVIAKEEVEIERVQRQIEQLDGTQANERLNL